MKANRAFFAGAFSALVITGLLALGRLLEITKLDFPMLWGTFATRPGMNAWMIGLTLHLFFGGVLGLAYGAVFEGTRRAGPVMGLAVGFVQFIFVGLILGIIGTFHPLIGRGIEAPGFFALNYGFENLIMLALVHMVFGSLNGIFYEVPLRAGGNVGYESA